MLILTRRIGETIMIGDHITVTVLGVNGNQVRLGIEAPKTVRVDREEVRERILREQRPPDDRAKMNTLSSSVACMRGAKAGTRREREISMQPTTSEP